MKHLKYELLLLLLSDMYAVSFSFLSLLYYDSTHAHTFCSYVVLLFSVCGLTKRKKKTIKYSSKESKGEPVSVDSSPLAGYEAQ